MKNLMTRRLVLRIFITLLLTFSLQGIADALVPETVVPQVLKRTSQSVREDDTVPVAAKDDLAISEIMYTTDTSGLPQWIELHNRSTRRVSLEGWAVTIENHPEDTSVLATELTFTLGAKILNADQVLLLVTEQGANSGVGETNGDIRADGVLILKDRIGGTPGYRLLSQTTFKVTLTAPTTKKTAHKIPSDIVGNLGAIPKWELPLIERNQRSSIIRVYEGNDTPDGTAADGWKLATEKNLGYPQGITYYGHRSDHGTPGYREPDPLPVALSHFRPARERSNSRFHLARERFTGAPIIAWTTESETNNAGFFIKRSQHRDGELKIINATLIPGAGTTHEKQSYTYTDTTARPNGVYYYQLECVSIDGTRRTLTRPIRLKGHIGASRRFEEAPFWWKDLR